MADQGTDLAALHVEWQATLNAMIALGVPAGDAVESMFTVATAGKMGVEGTRDVSRQLWVLAHQLCKLADDAAAEAAASRH